jgi:alcohol dehydrogenase (cytochrome c)
MGTIDAHVLAIDAGTGKLVWDTKVGDPKDPSCQGGICYAITLAPLVVKDKVLFGVAGGDSGNEGGIRGFVAALDTATGREVWRAHTIPMPGQPGSETWSGDSWKVGGAGVWVTGSYDPKLNLTYWGTGNPDGDPSTRAGDNLFSNSLLALDADTGTVKWHYQFTPHDEMDWDAAHVPVLAEIYWQGAVRPVVMVANKNGVLYVIDRATGQLLLGKPFVRVTWLQSFDESGRPIRVPGTNFRGLTPVWPGQGGTNWDAPSYSLSTGLLYVPAWEQGSTPQRRFMGGNGHGALQALDPATAEKKWEFTRPNGMFHGVLTTASDLVFTGADFGCQTRTTGTTLVNCGAGRGVQAPRDPTLLALGRMYALDARSGRLLWETSVGGAVHTGPITYVAGGKQFVAVAAESVLLTFAIR